MSCGYQPGIAAATTFCCAFAFSCAIACLSQPWAALAALCISFGIFLYFGEWNKSAVSALFTVNLFILLIWLTVPWTAPGEIVWRLGFLKISGPGLRLCLLATFKANAIILVFLGMMSGVNSMKLGLALAQMRISQKLALILILTAAHVEILRRQWHILGEAAKLRAFQAKASLRSWKVIAAMLAILFLDANERADKVYEALLLRGFSGKFPMCCRWTLRRQDCLLIFAILLCIVFLLFLDWKLPHV